MKKRSRWAAYWREKGGENLLVRAQYADLGTEYVDVTYVDSGHTVRMSLEGFIKGFYFTGAKKGECDAASDQAD